ncbi:uncharacterized protein LOC125076330 [Vanessa atalanta]|uniref:uncharacterized protein LOC125076330 n=1 Tax=Vanessa atalanta TaxID=42275 RepID=UPI001FCE1C93|nr:uncharacterized protein LOC125076330 [Vanessa atalanta]
MKCAKLHLQDRSTIKSNKTNNEKPRRFCQKRMVNPEHEEDPRWTDVYERFYCNDHENCYLNETNDSVGTHQGREDLFLTVQNLQFQGDVDQRRRSRTSFKYKTLTDSQKHRMFVKQVIDDSYQTDVARSSILSDYAENYTKYFSNNDQSRPSSSKSSIILYSLNNKCKENKSTQVDLRNGQVKKKTKFEKIKSLKKRDLKSTINEELNQNQCDNNSADTKITYHRNGKRKSLTISRADSPATVQVIRVDVVCNYSCSSTISDYDESKKELSTIDTEQDDKENQMVKSKRSYYPKKYVLTNTVKTLDENVSGGKVTLLCKTFKLTDRAKMFLDRKDIDSVNSVRPNTSKVRK